MLAGTTGRFGKKKISKDRRQKYSCYPGEGEKVLGINSQKNTYHVTLLPYVPAELPDRGRRSLTRRVVSAASLPRLEGAPPLPPLGRPIRL